jgi:CBS domain-containing protein
MEHVNHPAHYQRKDGIECIDIIRHYVCDIANAIKYLWRAGLKPEMGMEDAEKEIEDLKKALWYIEDYKKHINKRASYIVEKAPKDSSLSDKVICEAQVGIVTGYDIADIVKGYDKHIATAMSLLLQVGLIHTDGRVYMPRTWRHILGEATNAIQQRILDIEHQLLNKELESTVQVMNGQAVDGEDYVSKPGCVRETEPEHYDPLNMIVAWGRVYSLTDEVRKKPNGALYSPCDNCDLIEVCYDDWRHPDTSVCHDLCRLHQAKTNEYYREVGVAKYAPSFGTVEVVDEHKEMELELKRLEEEE